MIQIKETNDFTKYNHFGGIYKIESIIKPNRCYIGSAKDFANRWRSHIRDLKNNEHHSVKLQRHVNKYGIEDMVLKIILCCKDSELIVSEEFFINKISPYFNCITNSAGRNIRKVSKETREKISLSHMGKPKPMSEETKQKLRIALRGNKNGNGNKGKVRTYKQKAIYSKLTTAFFKTPKGKEQAENNRIINTGTKQSKKTIKKRMDKLLELGKIKKHKYENEN